MKMGLEVRLMLIGKKGATYFKRRSEIFNIAGVPCEVTWGSKPAWAAGDLLAAGRVAEQMGESCSGRLPTVGASVCSAWAALVLSNCGMHAHSTQCRNAPAAHSSFALSCLLSAAHAHCCWQLTDCNLTAGSS